jgi:hypothetical protein
VTVSQLRDSHRCLNFYTTDQLVLLSSQLAALVHKGAPLLSKAAMLLNLLATGTVDSRYTPVLPFFIVDKFFDNKLLLWMLIMSNKLCRNQYFFARENF